jgi:hypothetical protein
MATGRTLPKFSRVYIDGYDVSGYSRDIGPLLWEFDAADLTAQMNDAAKGYLPNLCNISPGTLNGVMQSTTDSGVEISRIQAPGTTRDIMIPVGIRAAPMIGDPVFCCKSSHNGFHVVENGGAMTITAEFGAWDASDPTAYPIPWGVLLHANGADTDVNAGTTDTVDNAVQTTAGGYMAYQILGGDITGTVRVQHSATNVNGDFILLPGCTTTIDGAAPSAGTVRTTVTTGDTVERYIRWQITVTTGTTLTFALAFVRGR